MITAGWLVALVLLGAHGALPDAEKARTELERAETHGREGRYQRAWQAYQRIAKRYPGTSAVMTPAPPPGGLLVGQRGVLESQRTWWLDLK